MRISKQNNFCAFSLMMKEPNQDSCSCKCSEKLKELRQEFCKNPVNNSILCFSFWLQGELQNVTTTASTIFSNCARNIMFNPWIPRRMPNSHICLGLIIFSKKEVLNTQKSLRGEQHLHNSSLDLLYSNSGLSECLITCSLALNQSSWFSFLVVLQIWCFDTP